MLFINVQFSPVPISVDGNITWNKKGQEKDHVLELNPIPVKVKQIINEIC